MMRGSRRKHSFIGLAWFIVVLACLTSMFAASYFLTASLVQHLGLHPPAPLVQIVNAYLGLVFTGLIVASISKVAISKGWVPEMNGFRPIIEALEKVAQGDFSIRLDNQFRDNQIVGELAKSVNKMALELDQMENLRQEFISNVSHEIQSPLTSIRGFAQALENEQLTPEDRQHYLDIIQSESTRLSRVTEDLLKLAALESEHTKFEPHPYRLDTQIRNLLLACEPQWMEKKLEMVVALDEIDVNADEDLLSQVWINLIHNSIKFTPQCGRISLDLHQMNGQIKFSIADSGIGISEADQARIFERFYKADLSRTRSNGGSGLGLSIVKKIVEMHHGTVGVASQPGEGTTFTVSLPVG